MQRAFLAGVRYGYRLGRKATRRDDDLIGELKDAIAPNLRACETIKNIIDTERVSDAWVN